MSTPGNLPSGVLQSTRKQRLIYSRPRGFRHVSLSQKTEIDPGEDEGDGTYGLSNAANNLDPMKSIELGLGI